LLFFGFFVHLIHSFKLWMDDSVRSYSIVDGEVSPAPWDSLPVANWVRSYLAVDGRVTVFAIATAVVSKGLVHRIAQDEHKL
jgi:negative regulator of sigma E activity